MTYRKVILTTTLLFLLAFSLLHPTSVSAEAIPLQDCIDAMGKNITQNACKFNNEHMDSLNTVGICYVSGCATTPTANGESEIIQKGAIASTSEAMTYALVTPPVHTATYVADVLHNTGLATQAYAQGTGFAGLSPVLKIWKAFRNITYFFYIVIFVVVGFMIMFRKKVSSNTIVTIQEALPKLIVTLLLITFSYAIAGFVIDLIYLSIFVMINVFDQSGIITDAGATQRVIFGKNIIAIAWNFIVSTNSIQAAGGAAIESVVKEALGGAGGVFWGFVADKLGYLIIAVAVLIALFRTLFMLIVSYVNIIVSVIFAPFQLLMNALPGSDAFSKWLKNLVANAAVFPAVTAMLILGAALAGQSGDSRLGVASLGNNAYSGFIPPLIGANGTSAAKGVASAVASIIGIGMVLLMPEVAKMVKQALDVKDSGLGEMAFKNAQAGWSPVTKAFGVATSPYNYVRKAYTDELAKQRQQEAMGVTVTKTPLSENLGFTGKSKGMWWRKMIGWG